MSYMVLGYIQHNLAPKTLARDKLAAANCSSLHSAQFGFTYRMVL